MNNPCTAQALTNIRIRQQNAWKSMQNTNYILNITDPSKYNLILIQEPWFDHVGKTWAMHNWHIVYRVCHEYRKTQGSESQCLRVQVWYLIWHTCAYPWTHAMVSWVHHGYIMGTSQVSICWSAQHCLHLQYMDHKATSYLLESSLHSSSNGSLPIFFMALSFIDDLIFMGEITSSSNYLCCLNADHLFFRILSFNSGTWQIFLSIREVGDFENPNMLKISYKLDWVSKGILLKLLTMVDELSDTGSTRSSTILNKATLSKKANGKAVKTQVQPLKKIKWTFSTHSATQQTVSCSSTALPTWSTVSHSSTSLPLSDHEADDTNDVDEEPDAELTPEQELGLSWYFILFKYDTNKYILDALKWTWHLPIYSFFKPNVTFQNYDGHPCHVFTCAAPKCKAHACVIYHFQDSKDKASTTNLNHHALHCFGEDAVNAVIARKEPPKLSHSIFTLFAQNGKQPVKYSHRVHTNPEVW